MITVKYYPSGEYSPLPGGARKYDFDTYYEFKQWVKSYVCIHCLHEFKDWHEKEPTTLSDWLWGGCGCEIGVEDTDDQIHWDDVMEYPTDYIKKEV